MKVDEFIRPFFVPPGKKVSLHDDYDPGYTAKDVGQKDADEMLEESIRLLAAYQDRLYAENKTGLLVIIQAMDAAGKDSAIKHVMSGINPQGCEVHSFKAPSVEELDHDYLWRHCKTLPSRGRIGISNRSYYEEVLVVRVHPEILSSEKLPAGSRGDGFWKRRFEEINCFEKYLVANGIQVVKLFLNVSKDEQRKRFLERIDEPDKNWKFSLADLKERARWSEYMHAYEEVLNHTSTEWAPWHVIPADAKWFTRLGVAAVVIDKLQEIDPQYPVLPEAQREALAQAKAELLAEG